MPALEQNKKPTLQQLLTTTLYIGTIGYGGPAILALMKKTFVNKRRWVSEKEFMDAISLAQILPGATGVSIMGYFGFKMHKLWGAILAPIVYILPATIFMIGLTWTYFTYGNVSFVKSLFAGLGALVVALLVNATVIMGRSVFKHINFSDLKGGLISLVTFIGIYYLSLNIIWLILLAGLLGFIFYFFTEEFAGEKVKAGETLLSEPSESLRREPFNWSDWIPAFLIGLIFIFGLALTSTRDLVTSFLKIGTFAFGGGFTTIPLIQHQVVNLQHWLTVGQFMNGIALGQITPGPVFITATFIGFHVAAIAGALLATLAIFTPSLVAMIALADIHARVKNLKAIQVIVKGFLSGFIGLLVAVTLQFAFKSLISWQAWLIFSLSLIWLILLKKESVWAILGAAVISLLIF